MSRMETRVMKIEEDLAEVKGMLKSLFLKMEKSEEEEQPTEKGAVKSALGPKVAQGRLDRESLAQLCWEGEFTKYQKMVFVSAPNYSLEVSLIHKREKIQQQVYGDLVATYKLNREHEQSSSVVKNEHLLTRMDETLQRLVYESEYNAHWTSADKWEKIPNEAALRVLRLEAPPRSRAEVARLLDDVNFP